MTTLKVDGYFWMSYRKHVGTNLSPPCACDLNGPDRGCDIGWALYKLAVEAPTKPAMA